MKPSHITQLMLITLLCSADIIPAEAHHSFALFDLTKKITIEGTISEIKWATPHPWIWIVVPGEGSKQPTTWAVEGAGVGTLTRIGVKKTDFQPGTKVKMLIHPLKDGRPGGEFLQLTLPDGRVAGTGQNIIEVLKDKGAIE